MSDILLLLGAALCALSVLMAIVSLLRTQPPRGAAIALVLGIVLLLVVLNTHGGVVALIRRVTGGRL